MYLIIGLGNPGSKYAKTRHNVGFDCIDLLADKYNITMKELAFHAVLGKGIIQGQKVILAKPQTFMNLSGDSVIEILNYYKLDPTSEFIVLSDDVTLEPGTIRIRRKGSAGGHNGLKSIIARCGTQEFARIKIGVGAVPAQGDMINHVLGHFTRDDRALVEKSFERAIGAIQLMVQGEIDQAMNEYNGKVE